MLTSAMNRTCLLAVLAAQLVMAQNPLFTESSLPYHLPPFAAIKDEHFAPAFEKGMTEELAEVDSIARNAAEPGLMAYTRLSQSSAATAGARGATSATLRPAGASASARLAPTRPAPTIATSHDAVMVDYE